ncbi:MAG TPA: protein kinase [Pyrinomonadaceae bacterium]|nr:protein kinase [Pyrinomonadaceae bacterium]
MRECPRCERCYGDEVEICLEDGFDTRRTLPGSPILASRYLLEKRLGRGAMGQVYVARDQNLATRRVAIKTVRPDILNDDSIGEGEAIARFEREARAAASVNHPNVVAVLDFGKSPEGVFYLVMEYVQGETLHQLLRREGTLSLQRALNLLRQAAAGIEAAHDEGILHRDLKPANIFIMQKKKKDGSISGDGFVKVGDFGLAKIVKDAAEEIDSATGPLSRGIIGTPEYMAPEQMKPGTPLDARCDVYALGTIAYHMLGGRPPFTGDLTQLIMQKIMDAAPSLSSLRSDIPSEVEHVIARSLERRVEDRPTTVAEWIEELEKAIGDEGKEEEDDGESRVVILAPTGAEVYVDDERHGSIGRSGRIILTSIAPGKHVLRVAQTGARDDERVIEVRPDTTEQIIEAQLRPPTASGSQLSPSQGGSIGSPPSSMPSIIACARCGSRFASGVNFCGRCGSTTFLHLNAEHQGAPSQGGSSLAGSSLGGSLGGQVAAGTKCQRCGTNYPPQTKFCGRCGIFISSAPSINQPPAPPVEKVCRRCGTRSSGTTRFCGRCGGPL